MPTTIDSLPPPPRTAPTSATRTDAAPRRLSDPMRAGRRPLILEADDLGLLHAFNEAIRTAHQNGCLSSTGLRANGYAYEHAIGQVLPDCPALGVGIHLCLNEAYPVAPRHRVPRLLARDGNLRSGFGWLIKLARTEAGRQQIERELRAQIERVLADGIQPDHLNSHMHVHLIPPIFRLTCRLANEYGITCVRTVREPFHTAGQAAKHIQPLLNTNCVKHLLLNHFAVRNAAVAGEFGIHTLDHFVGVNYTGHMDYDTVTAGLAATAGGSVEVLLHPALGPDPRDRHHTSPLYQAYISAPQRRVEFQTLISRELRQRLHRDNWAITTFAAWTQARAQCRAGKDADALKPGDRNGWARSILERFVPPRRPG